jgi:hypothetical protein
LLVDRLIVLISWIDKKSLFGRPQWASARTGRKHAETGLKQRCHGKRVANAVIKVNTTTKQRCD